MLSFGIKDETENIINSVWCSDYYIVAARTNAPSINDLKKFSKENEILLPKEFLAHASNFFGSFYLEVKEEIWPKSKLFDVGEFWTFLYGIFIYSFSEEAPEWMNISIATNKFKEMGHHVVPILRVIGDADIYCLDKAGSIVRYSHEENIFEQFNGNFFELLKYEVNELNNRRIKYKEKFPRSTTTDLK
jgi:hypothetical protein